MLAVFQVGKSEVHSIEVFSSLLFGREIVKVDGEEIINKKKFPIWFTDHMQFEIGNEEEHRVELKYNVLTLSSRAYVDGRLYVGCLFPQVVGYNAFILAIIALVISIIALVVTLRVFQVNTIR